MKRIGNLFDSIVDRTNLILAAWKALGGKKGRPEARQYLNRLDSHLSELSEGLRSGSVSLGQFRQFFVRDPKQRLITAPCFPERVLHHAIMNICEPQFERWLINDSFACRAGKGRDIALERASKFARKCPWFLSMDIRHYFDSISHELLNASLSRRFKDRRLLSLFSRIIGSYRGELGKGLPIGSLTSQHFANIYLDRLDRFIKETLRIPGYVRYMDDMAIWGSNRADLKLILSNCSQFLEEELRLKLKPTPFINRCIHGMDYLGVRIFPTYTVLNHRSRVRFGRRLRLLDRLLLAGRIDETERQQRATALVAFSRGARVSSWHFRRAVVDQIEVMGQMARTE